MDPLLPAGYDLLLSLIVGAPLLIIAAAVVVFRAELTTGRPVPHSTT